MWIPALIATVAGLAWAASSLRRLWCAVPRSNTDFGLV